MRVGTISYATQSGLGYLAKQFYDNGVINSILINPHPRYKAYPEWYRPEDTYSRSNYMSFIDSIDVLLIFENAFNCWGIVQAAQRKGVKLAVCLMYEWSPNPFPVKPDIVLCPSLLDLEYCQGIRGEFINIPAPNLPWKQRNIAFQFVHNCGHGQIEYAKGSPQVLEAFAKYVKSDAKLLVRGQLYERRIPELLEKYKDCKNITIQFGDIPYDELFATGDVYINAERYNGLSLPLQEAFASGMMVMTTNRFPANTWLPEEPLIPVKKYEKHSVNHTTFDRAEIDPNAIAKYVDYYYGKNISQYSLLGKKWAEEHSWEVMKPKYLELLQSL